MTTETAKSPAPAPAPAPTAPRWIAAWETPDGSAWTIGPERATIAAAKRDAKSAADAEAAIQQADDIASDPAIEWTTERDDIEDAGDCHDGQPMEPMMTTAPWARIQAGAGRVVRVGFADGLCDARFLIVRIG